MWVELELLHLKKFLKYINNYPVFFCDIDLYPSTDGFSRRCYRGALQPEGVHFTAQLFDTEEVLQGGECMEGIFMNMARLWFLSRCFLNSVFSFWNMILYAYIHNRIRIDIEYTYIMINTLLLSLLQTFGVPAFFTVQHFPQSTFAWPSKEGLLSTFADLHWFITLWFPVTGTMRMRWVGDYLIANFRCTAMGSTIRCSTLDEGFQVPAVDGWNPA